MNVLRRPLTLNAPSRGVPLVLLFSADWRTPVESSARAEYSRPFSASSRIWSPVITWLRWLESVSISGDEPVTTTFSDSWPTASCMSTRSRAPTCTWTLSVSAIEKPGFLGRHEVDTAFDRDELVGAIAAWWSGSTRRRSPYWST